jgi:hypothetical protein
MSGYQELMIGSIMADMSPMLTQELKDRIQAGAYKPDPAAIAESMLRRRSVRELLTPSQAVSRVGRSRVAPEAPRQAA